MFRKAMSMVSTRNTRRRSGFTLMEVLLVLAILGVIMTMVVPKVLGRQQHANADATRVSIGGLSQALKLYSLDHSGQFPASADGLSTLLRAPDARDPRWRGPYLEKEPVDAWGNPFQYEFPGRRNPDSFDISSAGPDGTHGTADDIGNWDAD